MTTWRQLNGEIYIIVVITYKPRLSSTFIYTDPSYRMIWIVTCIVDKTFRKSMPVFSRFIMINKNQIKIEKHAISYNIFVYITIAAKNICICLFDDSSQLEIRLFGSSIILLKNLGMKGSSLTENHLLRVNIGFHSVNLVAKFSCDIVLTLKTHDSTPFNMQISSSVKQSQSPYCKAVATWTSNYS